MSIRIELHRHNKRLYPGVGTWIRKRQVSKISGPPDPASPAYLCDHRGTILGWGLYSPESDICLRMIKNGAEQPPPDWLERRLAQAYQARTSLGLGQDCTGYREVNSEGDGLPGLVIDRYGAQRIVQITTAPMHAFEARILTWLAAHIPGEAFVLRPESAAKRESFPAGIHPVPSEDLSYREAGLEITVPAPPAQKTGAYHDQRQNRIYLAHLAAQTEGPMLDLGCHVGGFSLHAAQQGVACVALDQSAQVLRYAQKNAERNALNIDFVQADMFAPLRHERLQQRFGTIIFDPPKVVSSPRDLPRARTALSQVLTQLLHRIHPGGFLALCSCSHHLTGDELDQILLRASSNHRSDMSFWTRINRLGPGPDHPTSPDHPEGEYLRVYIYQRRE